MKQNRMKNHFCSAFAGVMMASVIIMAGCGAENPGEFLPVSSVDVQATSTESGEPDTSKQETSSEVIGQLSSSEVVEQTTSSEEIVEEIVKEVNRHWINNADISWIDPEKPMVALSFDDGPVNPVTDTSSAIRIQNALADNGMHATFFYWGNSLNDQTKKELERAYELGFELGNHTNSHPDLTKLSEEAIEAQVSKIDEVLGSITGGEQFLVRPPYLAFNQKVKDTINVPLISCGIDTQDWNNATTQQIIDKIVAAAEDKSLDGKIVLMHETYDTTAEAMEYLVPYLKEKGYQVVTISEMFKARGKEMEAGKVYTFCGK